MQPDDSHWWTPSELAPGDGRRWRLGTVDLVVLRLDSEWLTAFEYLPDDIAAEGTAWSVEAVNALEAADSNQERFAADPSASTLRLLPSVAERSVVASPRVPLHVLSRHQTKFFVSSPIWIRIEVGDPAQVLRELPTRRLSDTWFGPSTREGEVAFALKTQARTHSESMPRHVGRVITPVVVRNHTDDLLSIDRLSLPVPYLSVFHDAAGDLWTEEVVLDHQADSDMARLDIHPGAPPEAAAGIRLSDPRSVADESPLVRAFSTILRTFEIQD